MAMAEPTATVTWSTDLKDPRLQKEEEALAKARRLLVAMDEARLLDLTLGLVEERVAVGSVIVDLLGTPANQQGLRNLAGLVMLLARITPESLVPFVDGMEAATRRVARTMRESGADRPLGIGGVWALLKDPDVSRGVRALTAFFAAVGSAWSEAAQKDDRVLPPTGGHIPVAHKTPGPG